METLNVTRYLDFSGGQPKKSHQNLGCKERVIKIRLLGLPGQPVVKTWPSNAEAVASISCQGAKLPHDSWPKSKT